MWRSPTTAIGAKVMELGAWRAAVPYGGYVQPIHLQVVGADSAQVYVPAAQEPSSQSAPSSLQASPNPAEGSSSGLIGVREAPEPFKEPQTAPHTAQTTCKTPGITVIPPFASECLQNGQRMALNVGGPVWAMDWLPAKPAANAAAVAAALIKSTQMKPTRRSASSKLGSKKALQGKENNQLETPEDAEGETAAASTGSAEANEGSKLEWRFLALATHPPCQVEDGKLVKPTPPDHYYDIPETGRNLIQIWAIPVFRPKPGTAQRREKGVRRLAKPRMVYAIDHDSGVAWDLQWCPLVKKFPKANRRENILGVLAACFGDGSMRVFEIPAIPEDRLQANLGKNSELLVEKNIPVIVAKLPRILQLSVQWSPHNWNMLLTGGSDGSVSLWNIKSAIAESDSERTEAEPIEPQRRFQDADTVGKQEAFDWGCGWVAIRAVSWSPFDEHLFATTGNDSVFKVWDVREPRACLRSHRIRSTWGLALQWMDQTSIQISGDQGSVFMYDILTGSYQKLHFHPQVDSPVWDLQFARRGAAPLLVSSCTSGSIRAAPAKRLYRAPQNCVEICRLSGQKGASIEEPFKSLTVSFEKHSVLGTADAASLNTREFCERDAALHRLRLSSNTAGDYPCYLAAGGHAGLVILLELQEVFDTLIPTFFSPPSKKIGRPKKTFALVGADQVPTTEQTGPVPIAATSAGRKSRTLGSFASGKGIHTAISNTKKKGKGKARSGANGKPFIQADGEIEVEDVVEEEEPEYQEEDEDEDESDISLVIGDDSSDGDRISVSEDDVEEEETTPASVNPEEARLLTEYQLDLSEEDAILLAIQMSEFDEIKPATSPTPAPSSALGTATDVPVQETSTKDNEAPRSVKVSAKSKPKPKAKTKAAAKTKATAKPRTGKKRARSSNATANIAEVVTDMASTDSTQDEMKQPESPADMESKAPAVPSASVDEPGRPDTSSNDATAVTPTAAPTGTAKPKQPKKVPARKTTPKPKRESPMLLEAISQAMALQAFEYQMGMSEEDALKEALRLSEEGENKRRSSRSKVPTPHFTSEPPLPTPTQPKHTPPTPRAKGASQKKQKKVKEPTKKSEKSAATPGEEAQQQRPQTPRRLQFSPLTASEGGDQTEVPAANIDGSAQANGVPVTAPAPQVEATDSTLATTASPMKPPPKKPSPKKSPANGATKPDSDEEKRVAVTNSEEQKPAAKSPSTTAKTPAKKKEEVTLPASAGAAEAPTSTPKGKKPAKRSRTTGSKPAADSKPVKKRKKTTTSPRGRRGSSGDMMSEEDALLLALKMSEIEY